MVLNPDNPALAELLTELFGDAHIGHYTISEDGSHVQARVFQDGVPYLYIYEIDNEAGEYKLKTLNSLGRARL
jgi:hypothetical protein